MDGAQDGRGAWLANILGEGQDDAFLQLEPCITIKEENVEKVRFKGQG